MCVKNAVNMWHVALKNLYSNSVVAEFVIAKIDDIVNWARRVRVYMYNT